MNFKSTLTIYVVKVFMNKRLTGSFYTPKNLTEFIVKRVLYKCNKIKLKVLEPSAGDGAFVSSIYSLALSRLDKFTAIEVVKTEADKIRNISQHKSLNVNCIDFLEFQAECVESFDIIIGNPPYVKKSLLTEKQVNLCSEIHNSFKSLSNNIVKNIWSSFLVRGISLLNKNGVLAYVLPSELLQVNFTRELRELLLREFARIEIFTFNELLFKECKGQDTLILIAEKKSSEPGLYFCNVTDLNELPNGTFNFTEKKVKEVAKWTSHYLNQDEIELLEILSKNLKVVDCYCSSKAGIVTGANNFFIVNKDIVKEFSLQKIVKPILQKGSFVDKDIVFDKANFDRILNNSSSAFLIDLASQKRIRTNAKLHKYLQKGLDQELHLRYKARIRNQWYEVPNVGNPAQALFFKRCNGYPKFVRNDAAVLATDSAYLVTTRVGYDLKSIIYSFYNSLTLIFAELNGRFYGGGVLELTPKEFKGLPIPYVKISEEEFQTYYKKFNNMTTIEGNLIEFDKKILKEAIPEITDEMIEKLHLIRQKLVSRRIKL